MNINQDTINQYMINKQQCEKNLGDAKTQLAVTESQLSNLKEQAMNQFGTSDLTQLGQILNDLIQQKSLYEDDLSKIYGEN